MSVVVSVYNEEAALEEFYQTAEPIFAGLPWDYELVFVNDGSADRSAEILAGFAAQNPRVVVIEFSRNFGHEAAMIAGIDYARGDGIVCMDADLQHPPELAEDIVARFEEGYEVISMVRTENHSAGLVKNITSAGFYWFINRISDVELLENASDFFAISKNAADVLRKNYREKVKLVRFSINTILCFSDLPLKLGVYSGLFVGFLGLLLMIYTIWSRVRTGTPSGYATIVVALCFMFAMLFVVVGIIGEYISILFTELKDRPIYIVRRVVNREDGEKSEATQERE